MISYLGVDNEHEQNKQNNGADFLLFNDKLEPESRWVVNENERPKFGYDYWYQPFHNVCFAPTL